MKRFAITITRADGYQFEYKVGLADAEEFIDTIGSLLAEGEIMVCELIE
jgi:hypothetical protein